MIGWLLIFALWAIGVGTGYLFRRPVDWRPAARRWLRGFIADEVAGGRDKRRTGPLRDALASLTAEELRSRRG